MPEPTLDQIAPGGVVNLNNAPAGLDDATFDSLFPADTSPAIQPAQQVTAQPVTQPVQQTPQTTPQDQFFLQGDKSRYKSLEETVQGVNQKDALIEQLRQRYALTTGIDPITGKPVAAAGPTQETTDYYQQPDRYLDDLYAASKKSPEAYRDVQGKFLFDALKPLQPILQKAARDQAVESLSLEVPNAKAFIGTPSYTNTLELNPQLKEAITISEHDSRFHSRLPGLYKLAYLTAQGMQLPELLKAQQTQSTSQTQQVQQGQPVRTTVTASTPSPSTTPAARPSFKTIEGIRAYIQQAEGQGAKLDL